MKIKNILKSTLLISITIPSIAIITSCNVNANKKEEVTPVTPSKDDTKPVQPDSVKSYKITFKAADGQTGVTFKGPTVTKARENSRFSSVQKPTAYKDQRPQTSWLDEDGNQVLATDIIKRDMVLHPYFQADVELKNCLSVIALEHTIFNVVHHGDNIENTPNIEYSTDGLTWAKTGTTPINILPGEAIYLRGANDTFNKSKSDYTSFSLAGTVHINGSCTSLLDNGTATCEAIPEYCFTRLFENCSGIKVVSSNFLPVKKLAPHCYESMFRGCTNLLSFPSSLLPATNLEGCDYCYSNMFTGCTSLTEVHSGLLPAETLSPYCYFQMFRGCTGLTELKSGTLPAANLAEQCYAGMFRECTKIGSLASDLLPAKKMAPSCYYGMFADCTELKDVSSLVLPAGDPDKAEGQESSLASYCYYNMFFNCTALTNAPNLKAQVLAEGCYCAMFYNCEKLATVPTIYTDVGLQMEDYCYGYMFYNCKALPSAPTLSSTKLATNCYRNMFYNCSSLKTDSSSISLPALELKDYCYSEMFYGCSGITTAPTIDATSLAPYCCYNMFAGCSEMTTTPELKAETAAEGCYYLMFSGCTAVKGGKIGKIHLTELADYCCFMMFVNCYYVKINEYTTAPSSYFFHCPELKEYKRPVTSMFQNTNRGASGGYPATEDCYYTATNA